MPHVVSGLPAQIRERYFYKMKVKGKCRFFAETLFVYVAAGKH
jgi:hypothetical protein